MVLVVVLGMLVAGFIGIRRVAKRRLVPGLVGERPAFTVSPPSRRVGSRHRDAL